MTLFPEGTRSRDGAVGPGRPGPGLLILATQPRVIPGAIDGMQAVLPIGRYLPRIFKRIAVSFGSPVDYTDLLAMPRTRETASGGDRPRDGSDSGPARRAPAPAEARRRGRG